MCVYANQMYVTGHTNTSRKILIGTSACTCNVYVNVFSVWVRVRARVHECVHVSCDAIGARITECVRMCVCVRAHACVCAHVSWAAIGAHIMGRQHMCVCVCMCTNVVPGHGTPLLRTSRSLASPPRTRLGVCVCT